MKIKLLKITQKLLKVIKNGVSFRNQVSLGTALLTKDRFLSRCSL